jgi:hypothetical protein
MSYNLLLELYYGKATNADLVDQDSRELLHVSTQLDDFIPEQIQRGRDIILSGNPGDGKSHAVRNLADKGYLDGAEVELDLSARPTAEVVQRWAAARSAARPFVLCANQGPLGELLAALRQHTLLAETGAELSGQLGKLTAARPEELPPTPKQALLLDLADRNLLDEKILMQALARICHTRFLPPLSAAIQARTSAGRNLNLVAKSTDIRRRLAQLIVIAGRRAGEHFTFRHIWAALSFALTGAKQPATLQNEHYSGLVGDDTFPLSLLTRAPAKNAGKGPLIEAMRRFADPANAADPRLDDELWTKGAPLGGEWLSDSFSAEYQPTPPARLWDEGRKAEALDAMRHLKRLVALAHSEGQVLIDRLLGAEPKVPSKFGDTELLTRAYDGVKRLYLTRGDEASAAPWLREGLPLWVAGSYMDLPAHQRAHVAVTALSRSQLELLRPRRAPWLEESKVLGPPLEIAWLAHKASGIKLQLDPAMLEVFAEAIASEGAIELPERVQRYLIHLAGWAEQQPADPLGPPDRFAILERPRTSLVANGGVKHTSKGARYER